MKGFVWTLIGFREMEWLLTFKLDSPFTGGFDGLAQVRRTLDRVIGMLAGYN
jgi:hypothetical protein